VCGAATQVHYPGRGQLIEPGEDEVAPSIAEQLIVDGEPFQRADRPDEVNGLFHRCPRCVLRNRKDVDRVRNCVDFIARMKQRGLAFGPQHIADVADPWQFAIDDCVLAANRRDEDISDRRLMSPALIKSMIDGSTRILAAAFACTKAGTFAGSR
jgi:hypothetical protein